jgi:hypothetical protein
MNSIIQRHVICQKQQCYTRLHKPDSAPSRPPLEVANGDGGLATAPLTVEGPPCKLKCFNSTFIRLWGGRRRGGGGGRAGGGRVLEKRVFRALSATLCDLRALLVIVYVLKVLQDAGGVGFGIPVIGEALESGRLFECKVFRL